MTSGITIGTRRDLAARDLANAVSNLLRLAALVADAELLDLLTRANSRAGIIAGKCRKLVATKC